MRFAYADPPYPGRAHLYPEKTEVDHAELLDRLIADYPDGWALSTDSRGLWTVIPLLKAHPDRERLRPRVAIWHQPDAMPFGIGNPGSRDARIAWYWEAVVIAGGRGRGGDRVGDHATIARPGRRHGQFVGQKPGPFTVWVCRLLGVQEGDEVDDLFPGSGAFGDAAASYLAQLPLPRTPRVRLRRSGKMRRSRGWRVAQDGLGLDVGEAAG